LNIYISQGSAATEFRCGGRFYFTEFRSLSRIQKWKNYWNRSTFAKVIVKIKVAPFLMAHGVYQLLLLLYRQLNNMVLLCNGSESVSFCKVK